MHVTMPSFVRAVALFAFMAPAVASLSGCGDSKLGIRGTVLVDGQPVEAGMIHFEGVNQQGTGPRASAGAAIKEGTFVIVSEQGLPPGKYKVTVDPARKSGRKVVLPLRGEVEGYEPIAISNREQEITITPSEAHKIEIHLTAAQ